MNTNNPIHLIFHEEEPRCPLRCHSQVAKAGGTSFAAYFHFLFVEDVTWIYHVAPLLPPIRLLFFNRIFHHMHFTAGCFLYPMLNESVCNSNTSSLLHVLWGTLCCRYLFETHCVLWTIATCNPGQLRGIDNRCDSQTSIKALRTAKLTPWGPREHQCCTGGAWGGGGTWKRPSGGGLGFVYCFPHMPNFSTSFQSLNQASGGCPSFGTGLCFAILQAYSASDLCMLSSDEC